MRDAADAFRVWRAAGLRGRRLVVLTGQWSKPRTLGHEPPTEAEIALAAERSGDVDAVDARSALFAAARLGLVRSLDVVMPPSAFSHRRGEVTGFKDLERQDGAFRLHYNGLERRFSTPRAFDPPREPVLVLVEPTWFTDGAPADPLAWLSSLGVQWDLALVALEDPAASGVEQLAVTSFVEAAGVPFIEAAE